jgi:PAS domain S-box-containing protein
VIFKTNKYLAVLNLRQWGGLMVVLLLVYSAVFSWQSWRDEKAAEIRHLTALAELGGKSLDSYFEQYEHALELLSRDLLDERGRLVAPQRAQLLLRRFRQAYPELRGAVVHGMDGQTLAATDVTPGAALPSFANVPSFIMARDELLKGQVLSIARPLLGPITQDWIIPLRYGARDGKGRLLAVVSAVLPLAKPQSLWKDAPIPPDATLGLIRDDGFLVSAYPIPAGIDFAVAFGKPRTGALFNYLQREKFPVSGRIEGTGSLEVSSVRLWVFRRLSHYPVTFYVAAPLSNVRAAWWQRMQFSYLMLFLFLAGGYATYRWALTRQLAWEAARTRVEAKVQESQLRLEGMINSAMDAIISVDPAQCIVLFNAAAEKIFGHAATEMIGQPLDRLIPQRFRAGHVAHVRGFGATGVTSRNMGALGVVTGVRADGREFPLEASISQLRMGTQTVYTAILRDISERSKSEAQIRDLNADLSHRLRDLQIANEELESYSYTVAHDLRSPLRAIHGYSALVMKTNAGKLDQASVDDLKRVQAASERMGELIDDLLNLMRVSRQEMRRQDFNLSVSAAAVVAALAAAHPERTVPVTIQPDMHAHGDPGLMRVVLDNLIGNAWKFTARTGAARIEIGTEQRDGKTVYYVRDNGAGFDMEYAHKLFTPFQRLHGHEEFAGMGIGLSLVKRVVVKHGGEIWAAGKEGHGAIFYFTLG